MSTSRPGDDVLLDTIHGSHLYGLAHSGSDRDRYVVIRDRPNGWAKARWAKQTILPTPDGLNSDVMVTDLASFLSMCDAGVPQALEAMFSAQATTDRLADLRAAYRAGTSACSGTYIRTMKSFALAGDAKRRRHALRLALNLSDLLSTGRFDPRLTAAQGAQLTLLAADPASMQQAMDQISPLRVDLGEAPPLGRASRRRFGPRETAVVVPLEK